VRAVRDVELVNRKAVDSIAPSAFQVAWKIGKVVDVEGGATPRAIERER
jgi:hypothetical protein